MKTGKIATSKFQNFGLRRDWLIFFLCNIEDWISKTNLGNRQVESLKTWLRESELLEGDKPTVVAKILSKILTKDELFVWKVVWTNLYYNVNLIKWYLDTFDWGSTFSRKDLLLKLLEDDESAKERTAKNAISSLLNLLDSSPIGYELKIGVVKKIGGERYVKKIGTDNLHPLAVAYSLYKAAEHMERRDFTVSELYSKEFQGGPYKLFGIPREKLERILRGLDEDRGYILNYSRGNIYLREDLSPLDILKFKLYRNTLKVREDYLPGLLLNLLYKYVEVEKSSSVVSSEEYIIELLKDTIDALKEIKAEKNRLRSKYCRIDKILNCRQKESLKNFLSSVINRDVELTIIDGNLDKHLIRKKIEKAFKKDYTIHLCLFFGRNEKNIIKIKNLLKELSNEDDFKNVVFVLSEVVLDDETFEKFIQYKAIATVADKHNYNKESKINKEYAEKIIDSWINRVKFGYVQWFLQDESDKELMHHLSKKINEELSRKIFTYGLENIKELQKNRNVWTHRRSIRSVEIFLFANSIEDIEKKTVNYPYRYLREILKDNNGEYIVDVNLKIKENTPEDHPLKKMYLEIKRTLEKEKNKGTFNLGDTLEFLTKPPYGTYSNMIYMGAIGFIMREYTAKLFEAETGMPIQRGLMRDKILDLFKYWEKGDHREKLEVFY